MNLMVTIFFQNLEILGAFLRLLHLYTCLPIQNALFVLKVQLFYFLKKQHLTSYGLHLLLYHFIETVVNTFLEFASEQYVIGLKKFRH